MERLKYTSSKNEKAFTLVEMIVAIVVLGILVGIAIPVFSTFIASKSLDAAIRQVASDIREAQARAMAEERYYKVYFDENENCYFVYHGDTTDTWSGPLPWGAHDEVTITLPSGIEYEEITFSNNDVQFQPNGYIAEVPGTGGVYLRNNKGKTRHLTVMTTGKVNIY